MVPHALDADGTASSALDAERLYREVAPSVVSIYLGDGAGARGAGSGFVYDDVHVVTNQHVVGDRSQVHVRFADGRWRGGRVVGVDAYTDLAVVRVAALPADVPALPVATDVPTPGRPVAALGNPMGLDGSITLGIVSGVNRSLGTRGGFAVPDVVQTDAAINPGNSGGPLVAAAGDAGTGGSAQDTRDGDDDEGNARNDEDPASGGAGPRYEVVGVNRAKQGDNIGFAVSARLVSRVVPDLVEDGVFRHPYLRVRTLDVTPSVAEANGITEPRGVLVVDADGASNGLRGCSHVRQIGGREVPAGGDVLVAVDGTSVRSHEELMRYLIVETSPGDAVELTVLREGERDERTVTVELGERPDTTDAVPVR